MNKLSYKTISAQTIEKISNNRELVKEFAHAGHFNHASMYDAQISGDLKDLEIHHFDWDDGAFYLCQFENVILSDGTIHEFEFSDVKFKNVTFKNVAFKKVKFTYDSSKILPILENVSFENCTFESLNLNRIKDSSVKFLDSHFFDCMFKIYSSTLEFHRCSVAQGVINASVFIYKPTVPEPVKVIDCTSFCIELCGDPIDTFKATSEGLLAIFDLNVKNIQIYVKYGAIDVHPNCVIGNMQLTFFRTGGFSIDESKIDQLKVLCTEPSDEFPSFITDSTVNQLHTLGLKIQELELRNCKIQEVLLHNAQLGALIFKDSTLGLLDIDVCHVKQKVELKKTLIGRVKISHASLEPGCAWDTEASMIATLEKCGRNPTSLQRECVETLEKVDGQTFKAYFNL